MQAANARSILGWGIYSASSWTWCIGLYLPIIMLRLFGWPGFLLFAIPNIAGVVLFGYLFDERRSRDALETHRPAVRLFSIATAGYQLFFIGWLWTRLLGDGSSNLGAMVALGAWLIGLVLVMLPDRAWVWLGVGTWAMSIVLFTLHGADGLGSLPASGSLERSDLLLLAPAVIFGFMFCPWLDASFHRARIRSKSPHVFVVFALTFAPMILFTCCYGSEGTLALDGIILAQLTMQATFTTAVHLREAWLGGPDTDRRSITPWPWAAFLPGCAILLGTLPFIAGETTYLRILGLYGLVFPAYALLFMRRRNVATPNRTSLLLFALLLIPCGIAFDRAFIDLATAWVPFAVGGLLLLVCATWLLNRRPTSS
ncbi:MAG: hypothetical protein MK082_03750 [Phycisphaerales bacterium]|nr:hypothetical protein [Phycisphaerales bacterium]